MVSRVRTVAFQGVEAVPVDVQVLVAPGKVGIGIVGLADKAVTESRERVQAALHASGLSMPPKRVTVNLAPADLPKEGSHYDLPIALGLMAALGALPPDALEGFLVLGELSLDGLVTPVSGVLPAAMAANALGLGLICPEGGGAEAAWADPRMDILAPRSLIQIANHFRGTQRLARPEPALEDPAAHPLPDLSDIKGQTAPKRALEIAAAGNHNLLTLGTRDPAVDGGSATQRRFVTSHRVQNALRRGCIPLECDGLSPAVERFGMPMPNIAAALNAAPCSTVQHNEFYAAVGTTHL